MAITLNGAVTSSGTADKWDIRQLKKALNRLGYYHPRDATGITGDIEQAMFDALKAYQRLRKLPVTGQVSPNDATIKSMNADIEEGQESYYIWRTVDDEKVRSTHSQFSGTVRAWEKTPDPGEDYNCRCWADTNSTLIDGISDAYILAMIEEFEKYVEHLYKDNKGNVTVGIGIFLEEDKEAAKLPFMIRDPKIKDGERPATTKEIEDAYNKVKNTNTGSNVRAEVYRPKSSNSFTDIYLPEGKAFALAREHLRENIPSLKSKFPDFNKYPPAAQHALLDMEYNLGSGKFVPDRIENGKQKGWPKLFAAIKVADWQTAAKESNREGLDGKGHSGKSRNEFVFDLFQQAAKQKSRIFKA